MKRLSIRIKAAGGSLPCRRRDGQTIDLLLTAHRYKNAPDKVTIDKGRANTAALEALLEETGAAIEIRQAEY